MRFTRPVPGRRHGRPLLAIACFSMGLWALGCGDDDTSMGASSDAQVPDASQHDASTDADPLDADAEAEASAPTDADTPPAVDVVGTPPRAPTGAGERPVVFWPKPVYAHPEVPVQFTMVAFDPEHEQLLFSLEGAPGGMTINAAGAIEWDPEPTGTFEFEVHIDDGRGDPTKVPVTLAVDATKFVFVSPAASDGTGTIDDPMGDLEAAQRKLADMGGGTLYMRQGTYAVHWNWETGGVQSPLRGADGTPEAPFILRGFPGESVVVDCEEQGHGFWSFAASYVLFADFEVRRPSAGERGGVILDGHDVVAQNVVVRDANWPVSSNCTGFLLRADNAVCHRCQAFDNYDRTESHWNSSNYLTYPDSDGASIYILDSYSEGSVAGYKVKHAGTGHVVVHGNLDRASDIGFGGMDDGTVIRFNTFVDNETGLGLAISDPNAYTGGDMVAHNNTIVRARRAVWVGDTYAKEGGLLVRDNVVVSDAELGSAESDPLMAFVWPYTPAPDAAVIGFERNCYHAPNTDAGFRFGEGSAGSFAAWQGRGLDVSSVWADPLFAASSVEDYRVGAGSACAALTGVGAW